MGASCVTLLVWSQEWSLAAGPEGGPWPALFSEIDIAIKREAILLCYTALLLTCPVVLEVKAAIALH